MSGAAPRASHAPRPVRTATLALLAAAGLLAASAAQAQIAFRSASSDAAPLGDLTLTIARPPGT
ncbi:MAG TPA: hypothetical protein VIB08_04165, partial [Thermoanaerobaculia bacterium]